MNISVLRQNRTPWAVDGELWISGQKVCDTTESRSLHLPKGEYPLTLRKDEREGHYGQLTPYAVVPEGLRVLQNLPEGAITYGNGVARLKSPDIHIGRLLTSGLCIGGRETFRRLIDRIVKARMRNHKEHFTLTIK